MRLGVILLCAVVLYVPISPSSGQDPFSGGGEDPFGGTDPFGDSSSTGGQDPFGTSSTLSSGAPGFGMAPAADQRTAADSPTGAGELDEETDPVVRWIRESPPKTVTELAQAFTWLSRLRRWDEVGRLLDRVSAMDLDLPKRAALAREAGSALWIGLRSLDEELTDEQLSLVREILRAPAALARDPSWLNQWIDKLASDSPGERRLAQLRLQDGSTVAILQLVSRLLAGDSEVAPTMLAGTVLEFGKDGIEALQAAAQVADPDRVSHVLCALAGLSGRHFAAELGTALVGDMLPPEAQSRLAQTLSQRYGALPSERAVRSFLKRSFEEALAEYQAERANRSGLENLVWRLAPDQQSVQVAEGASHAPELERLAQLANLRLKVGMIDQSTAVECGAALLQRAYQVNPRREDREIRGSLLTDLRNREFADAEYWTAIFEQASEWQMHGAALRSLQLQFQSAGEVSVESVEEQINYLSDLLSDPRPIIRYSALQMIDAIDPTLDYRGSDQAIATALEMSQLQSGPQSLVIGLQSHLREAAQQQIQMQAGGKATTVNSARAALQVLDGNSPLELIFIVDRVPDQSLFELLQRLRKSKLGHALPIAIMTDQLYSYERDLIQQTPGVVTSVLSRNAEQVRRVIAEMLQELDTQPLAPEDRLAFSEIGQGFLARIAGDRQRYRYYYLSDFRHKLVGVAAELAPRLRTEVLSGVGTRESQHQLFRTAASGSLAKSERLTAANAFADSVKRFGLQLDKSGVSDCYDLYNRLGPQDPVATLALGFCLDVIEAQAGKAEWPERL